MRGRDQKGEVKRWNELAGFSFKAAKTRRGPCLFPVEPPCTTKTCEAHSIQNRTVLDALAEEGHVVMLRTRRVARGQHLRAEFKWVGRNEATTFAGLCAPHDAKLFAPIDQRPLDLEDREQLFLLAYRSVLRQAHSIPTGTRILKRVAEKRTQLGLPDHEVAAAASGPVRRLRDDVGPISEEKDAFDRAYLGSEFGDVEHEIAWTLPSPPSLAVSSFFSLGRNSRNHRQLPVALNVFPHDGRHAIVLSYRKPSKPLAQNLVFALKQTSGEERLRALSRLVLKDCEHFVLRPSLYSSFGNEQEQLMRDCFLGTLYTETLGRYEIEPVAGLVKGDDVEKLNLFKAIAR
jgi:hypothetical protein